MGGIIIASSGGWAASGKVPRFDIPLELTIPLERRLPPNSLESPLVTLTEVVFPSVTTVTVNPSDIPQGEFKDFPFGPLLVVARSIEAVLIATYGQGSNSSETPAQPVVLPGTEVKVKSHGEIIDRVKLNIEWTWKVRCHGPQLGVTNDMVVPLKLDAGSHYGWETPVTLQLQLLDGHVLVTKTVVPKDIPLDSFKDFILRSPDRPEKLELIVTANQTGGPGSTLIVGDLSYIILHPK